MNETTTKLSLFDTVELQLELERREKIKEESEKPKPELNPDYSPLRKLVIGYIDQVHKKGAAVDEEFDHYIFEVAVTAIYGKNVWGWINKKTVMMFSIEREEVENIKNPGLPGLS